MTIQKKLEHIWEYYRWHILLGLLAVAAVLGILAEWNGRQVPDYEIAVMTRRDLTEKETALLDECFTSAAAALDSGKDKVLLTAFRYDPDPEEEMSGGLYNGVALNAELTGGNCLICVVDEQAYEMLRSQGDDFLAPIGAQPYVLLASLFPELPESLGGLRVCLRSADSVFLETAESARARFEAHRSLVEICMR